MMTPTFDKTLTLYHQQKVLDTETNRYRTVWERSVHTECFFGVQDAQGLSGTTLSIANGYTARIPYFDGELSIGAGDILVLGEAEDELEDGTGRRATDLLAKYKPDAFTVRAVSLPQGRYGKHYKVLGV